MAQSLVGVDVAYSCGGPRIVMRIALAETGKNVLLAVVSTAVFLGALEEASRWIHPVRLPYPVIIQEEGRPTSLYEHDYLLFWRLKPNVFDGGRPFTNSLGLRGPEVPGDPSGEFRILSLGESSTFGWRVRTEETYSAILESRLRFVDGRRVRVVNAGVPSYTSFQGYQYLRERGLDLEPDAVLIYFGANDIGPAIQRAPRSARWLEDASLTDAELFAMRRSPLVRASSLLLEHSNFYRILALPGNTEPGTPPAGPPKSRVSTAERRQVLSDYRRLCAERGIRFVIAIPWYLQFRLHVPLLREFAAENAVPLIDLPALLDDLPEPRESYFLDITHPNARGHRLIAQVIEEALRELWHEPPEPQPAPAAPSGSRIP